MASTPAASPVVTDEGIAPPLSFQEVKALLEVEGDKPRFDGAVQGWRVAPYAALVSEGLAGRGLSRSCEPNLVGAETPTNLDFTVGYWPDHIKLGPVSGPEKWLCDDEALSVAILYSVDTALGSGQLWIERAISGHRVLEMDVAADSVEAAEVSGRPAIFVHPADDRTGLGIGRVVVIEDESEPNFTILSVTSDNGIPFDELVKIVAAII